MKARAEEFPEGGIVDAAVLLANNADATMRNASDHGTFHR